MDYEQKYKDALERAKEFVCKDNVEVAEYIFPELAESGDEKIRKTLIKFHKSTIDIDGIKGGDIIAWLKKQGEKSLSIMWHDVSEEPDEMSELFCEWESDDATWHDIAFYDKKTGKFRQNKMPIDNVIRWVYVDELLEKQVEQKPLDYECANIQQKDFAPGTVGYEEARLTPLERKVKDFLFDFHINATDGMSFDGTMAIVHNLITVCQKQEWSEEDEEHVSSLLKRLEGLCRKEFATTRFAINEDEDWLKSIKERMKEE